MRAKQNNTGAAFFLSLHLTLRYAQLKILNHKICFITYKFAFKTQNKSVTLRYE